MPATTCPKVSLIMYLTIRRIAGYGTDCQAVLVKIKTRSVLFIHELAIASFLIIMAFVVFGQQTL